MTQSSAAPFLRIGTRGSPLALWQAHDVRARLATAHGVAPESIAITVIKTSGDIVEHYSQLLLDGAIDDDTRKTLITYMDHGSKNEPKPFVLEKDLLNDKVRGLLHLLMAVPEYQLA